MDVGKELDDSPTLLSVYPEGPNGLMAVSIEHTAGCDNDELEASKHRIVLRMAESLDASTERPLEPDRSRNRQSEGTWDAAP